MCAKHASCSHGWSRFGKADGWLFFDREIPRLIWWFLCSNAEHQHARRFRRLLAAPWERFERYVRIQNKSVRIDAVLDDVSCLRAVVNIRAEHVTLPRSIRLAAIDTNNSCRAITRKDFSRRLGTVPLPRMNRTSLHDVRLKKNAICAASSGVEGADWIIVNRGVSMMRSALAPDMYSQTATGVP